MNIKDILIPEIEIPQIFAEEAVSALLHTIFFIRAPNFIKPVDHQCKLLAPLIYAKCGPEHVDQTVRDTIVVLNKVRVPLSPGKYGGILNVSFFEMKKTTAYFGLTSHKEKIYFERWKIPVIINENDIASHRSSLAQTVTNALNSDPPQIHSYIQVSNVSSKDKELLFKYGITELVRNLVQQRLQSILEAGSSNVDHVPFTNYEYDIEVSGMDEGLSSQRSHSI